MSIISGLPAHILLNHFVVVLVPLTAILLIVCAVWPAARLRLVWLVLVLAVITVIITPLTVAAGNWLAERVDQTPELDTHAGLGETTIYFAVALLVAAGLLAVLHVRLEGGHAVQPAVRWAIAVVLVATAGATLFQIHRIGESGARAAWGTLLTSSNTQ